MQSNKYQDYIKVENINSYTKIGVADNERFIGQKLKINLKVYFSLLKAGQTDLLEDTVSYVELVEIITNLSQQREFKLIEHFGHEICLSIFAKIPKIEAIQVEVYKPHIPSPNFQGLPSINIFREKNK